MSERKNFKDLLDVKREMEDRRPDLIRIRRLLDDKRERGIIPKKISGVPTPQDTERYGYKKFLTG
ncbi:MAG: hypothetical protein ACOZF2_12710 [Thermodesulfobacteriota bacterium]